ncbi:DUF4124 domain-containing protein [Oceanicoccus sagamiensis]|uniref:DUF4124 domain-containing protein n=1 Tax=Oceanicoccus sagamiensis TaxID=716816 RepID=A0A1X9N6C9_9GAMM|nr:DUF4124 domain-containing protein [Oceanicoccus sagamiensis]ARN73660.1 hypothetical protein BST96_05720 [Oceanicoccus sagamiensis]
MSFKAKFTLLLFVLLALGMPMVMKGPDGRPLMTLSDWVPNLDSLPIDQAAISGVVDQLQQASPPAQSDRGDQTAAQTDNSAALVQAAPTPVSSSAGTLYKWQDEKGRWHFSNQKPVTSTQVSMEALPEVENVMEAPVNKGDNSSSIRLPGGLGF